MFAIVLICLFLCIVHFMTTTIMLYGVIKRRPGMILPFFFTGIPTVVMCTAYAVLWWSGDIFNEQLTMSVTEFVLSLGINAICIVIVLFYYYRLTGQLTSDGPRQKPPFHTNYWNYPNDSHRISYETGTVPPWRTEWSEEPPWALEQKLRRRERLGTPVRPILGYKQGSRQSWRRSADNLYREYPQYPTLQPRQASTPQIQQIPTPAPIPTPLPTPMPMPQPSRPPSYQTMRSNSSPAPEKASIRNYEEQCRERRRSKRRSKSRNKEAAATASREAQEFLRRKSPQRVSFTRRAPKVYERTPESSISGGLKEKHTVV
uniref:Uncharacterized protein n=1 Tax=Panagrolaimus davidi TaxID=227884 RepID=A0A914P3E1_9BILA